MIGCLRTRVRKQPIVALYFESETVLKFYNLEARLLYFNVALLVCGLWLWHFLTILTYHFALSKIENLVCLKIPLCLYCSYRCMIPVYLDGTQYSIKY